MSTDLIGNGSSLVQLLEEDREAIFTRPDQTRNELLMLNQSMNYRLSTASSLSSLVYRRAATSRRSTAMIRRSNNARAAWVGVRLAL